MNRLIASNSTDSTLVVRIVAAAVAGVVLGSFVLSGASGTSASATVGEGLVSVNRINKGNRLTQAPADRLSHNSTSIEVVVPPKPVPFGCDPAFSPVADPERAYIYKRCLA